MSGSQELSALSVEGSVATLTMTNEANRQNPAFALDMLSQLTAVEANENGKALVITSNDEKNFSQGIDVEWLMPAMKQQKHDEVRQFMNDRDEVRRCKRTHTIAQYSSSWSHGTHAHAPSYTTQDP